MKYLVAESNRAERDWLYQVYITDALKVIAGNTVGMVKEGRIMAKRYYDLIVKPAPTETDGRTGQEVAKDIIGKMTRK